MAWRAAPAAERDFHQGLVHVTVAWYQAGRGSRVGCKASSTKARRRLARSRRRTAASTSPPCWPGRSGRRRSWRPAARRSRRP